MLPANGYYEWQATPDGDRLCNVHYAIWKATGAFSF